jgi:hypothetical protein
MNWKKLLTLAGAALMAAACAENSGPVQAFEDGPEARPFFSTAPAPGMDVLGRTVPLAYDMGVKAEVDDDESTWLRLPAAGIEVYVPAGAVDDTEWIGLLAHAGDRVAFEFYPHGITFNTPITIKIEVEGTEAEYLLKQDTPNGILNDFLGVYYEGDGSQGNVDAVETFPVYYGNGKLVFQTTHFSGYALAF